MEPASGRCCVHPTARLPVDGDEVSSAAYSRNIRIAGGSLRIHVHRKHHALDVMVAPALMHTDPTPLRKHLQELRSAVPFIGIVPSIERPRLG